MRGDLDWIVMKAWRRTGGGGTTRPTPWRQEIERHLSHEPVSASPPSGVRARKFVRRHRVGVAMAAAVSLALTVGLVLALVGFKQAGSARQAGRHCKGGEGVLGE